ncbi:MULTISPECIES: hypothetical protein [unclassified Bradyrhizobium]|uniref:hypothetical protein n=1 Tax=unclassified Bradyrhizobium TaxID=2631580 RepID=UPI002478E2D9|nr:MULTISPECIES: hypothetical protein [unclassified Bradyrhizobium]WGS18641.1 hypothetical protein MTX22_29390 [Bradyrhizobium sp. ISRA463]WGS25464.1 hypothetical protein MTX19_26970 [Bradyrhizobium sp. ISRA464]
MQVLISLARFCPAFFTESGAASIGLAMEMKSQVPSDNSCSANSGVLIRDIGLHGARLRVDLLGGQSILDEIDCRDAVHDQE